VSRTTRPTGHLQIRAEGKGGERDDFYDPSEIDRLLTHAPRGFEEAFWLCGAHAGLRLPGEALGLRWGAVDFNALVLRPYDNWVRDQLDTPKTSDCEAIPMTPRLARALLKLKQRPHLSRAARPAWSQIAGLSRIHLR
jgi:integrase